MTIDRMLSQMASEFHSRSPAEIVDGIVDYARATVDGDDGGVLVLKARGRLETPASTSRDVDTAHNSQEELGEGPCLDAVTERRAFIVGDTATDDRFPNWGPRCAQLGYRSTISVSMSIADRPYGSLNVYSHRPGAFSSAQIEPLELLAVHATVALAAAQNRDDMQAALDSRTLIGQAQGILMHAYDLDASVAFDYMRRLSSHENVKLVQIAQRIVDEKGIPATAI